MLKNSYLSINLLVMMVMLKHMEWFIKNPKRVSTLNSQQVGIS